MVQALMAARFRLGEILEQSGMTQSELARASQVTVQTVNAIANNRTTRVDLSTLDKLAKVLGCEPGDLIERVGKGRK